MSAGRLLFRAGNRDPFSPYHIPRSLKYSEVDFERSSLISTVGGNISAFADPICGASWAQGTSGSRPAYEATGFNGRPCALFDGVDDYLRDTMAVATLGWPTGGAFEIWMAAQDLGAGPDAATFIFNYPSNAATQLCDIGFSFGSLGQRLVRFRCADGTATQQALSPGFTPGSRVVIRARSDGSTIRVAVNGVDGAPVACVASFGGTARNTLGARAGSTASAFQIGRTNFFGFYKPLPTIYSAGLYDNLNIRKG